MRSRKALWNILASITLQITTVICGLVIPRLIISTYGSGVNGIISSISQFLGLIFLLEAGIGGIGRASLYKPLAENDILKISGIVKSTERFFRTISFAFIGYSLAVALFFSFFSAAEFDYLYTFFLVLIIGISTFIEYCFGMSYYMLLMADQRLYFNSILQIATLIINSILTIVLILSGAGIHLVKLVSALVFVIRPFALNYYVKRKYNIIKDCQPDTNVVRRRWEGIGDHIAFVVRNYSDVVVLTLFADIKEVSVYSVYFMVVFGIQRMITTFSTGLEAAFGNIIAKNESKSLVRNFSIYEFFSFAITTILFISAAILILPFITLYTGGITDADYIRPEFAYILIASQVFYCIRIPYNAVVLAAGHYKQTSKAAFAEAVINVVLSVIFIKLLGLTGVALGSLCAIVFRAIYYVYYLSKNILHQNVLMFFKRTIIAISSSVIVLLVAQALPINNIATYSSWLFYSVVVVCISSVVVLSTGVLLYRNDIKNLAALMKNMIMRRNMNSKEESGFNRS